MPRLCVGLMLNALLELDRAHPNVRCTKNGKDHKHGVAANGDAATKSGGMNSACCYNVIDIACEAGLALASLRNISQEQQGKEGSQKELPALHSVYSDRHEVTKRYVSSVSDQLSSLVCRRNGAEEKVL